MRVIQVDPKHVERVPVSHLQGKSEASTHKDETWKYNSDIARTCVRRFRQQV